MFLACNFLGPLSPIYTQCTCMLTSLNIKYTIYRYIHSIQIYFYPIGNVKILKNSTGFPRCPVVKTFSQRIIIALITIHKSGVLHKILCTLKAICLIRRMIVFGKLHANYMTFWHWLIYSV